MKMLSVRAELELRPTFCLHNETALRTLRAAILNPTHLPTMLLDTERLPSIKCAQDDLRSLSPSLSLFDALFQTKFAMNNNNNNNNNDNNNSNNLWASRRLYCHNNNKIIDDLLRFYYFLNLRSNCVPEKLNVFATTAKLLRQ